MNPDLTRRDSTGKDEADALEVDFPVVVPWKVRTAARRLWFIGVTDSRVCLLPMCIRRWLPVNSPHPQFPHGPA